MSISNLTLNYPKPDYNINVRKMTAGNSPVLSNSTAIAITSKECFLNASLNTTERDSIEQPLNGMQIYNTTSNQLEVLSGNEWIGLNGGITGTTGPTGPTGPTGATGQDGPPYVFTTNPIQFKDGADENLGAPIRLKFTKIDSVIHINIIDELYFTPLYPEERYIYGGNGIIPNEFIIHCYGVYNGASNSGLLKPGVFEIANDGNIYFYGLDQPDMTFTGDCKIRKQTLTYYV